MSYSSRETVLRLLRGESVDYVPNFSGMGSITLYGIKQLGYRFNEVHVDAHKMAEAAASTYRLFGFESVIVPFDMGVEAEALGAEVKYYEKEGDQIIYPVISKKLAATVDELNLEIPADLAHAGRIPVVIEAIRILKEELGDEVAVGSWVLGPFTEMGQIMDLENLLKMSLKKGKLVNQHLSDMVDYLVQVVNLYIEAGADFITVREMGATSDILSPRMFKKLVLPHLQDFFGRVTEAPTVLHICGNTNPIVEMMAQAGADAISVDQKNDLGRTRELLGDVVLLGNYSPYGVLCEGTPEAVDETIHQVITDGADGIWPGCDIWPSVPPENMEAMMQATQKYGAK
ncbi:MAG: MtaA/CmuA family methyltransferase [Chloroflexi bacterium]|nr:MtaA/CmuA family methyltransferase [Chloroflexota bacterium]